MIALSFPEFRQPGIRFAFDVLDLVVIETHRTRSLTFEKTFIDLKTFPKK